MISTRCRSVLLVTTAVLGLSAFGAPAALAQSEPTYQFDIPAEPLGQALTDFSAVSSKQIIMSEDAAKGRTTKGLHGRYTAQQALDALLAGTDLRVETNAAGVLMVRSKNSQAASNEAAPPVGSIETVTVTGTHLRNVEPLTPVTTITGQQITNQGYTTLSQAIADLPQNSSNGASPQSSGMLDVGSGATNNNTGAAGFDLRGLGPNDTLVLLNGQRLPQTALGTIVDISTIPVSTIDRIEILADGASAVYGADAVAGVVNIITKKDYEGIETGGSLYNIANGKSPDAGGYILGGFDWGTGDLVLNYDYEDQQPLSASARSFTRMAPLPQDIEPAQQISTLYGSLTQQITNNLDFSGIGIYSSRKEQYEIDIPGFSAFDENSQNSRFTGTGQLHWAPTADWNVTLVGQFGNERDVVRGDYVDAGESTVQPYRYISDSVELQVDGTVLTLPGGDVKFAAGVGDRWESFTTATTVCLSSCFPDGSASLRRSDFSAYGELLIPLIGEDNQLPLVKKLQLDVAVRYDHYSDFGSTTNPKVTLQYEPTDDFSLHGSYSTSFKAPTLFQLGGLGTQTAGEIFAADPANPGLGNALEYFQSSNPNLMPETAKSYSLGGTFRPHAIPGLQLDASYFNIDYTNEIVSLNNLYPGTDIFADGLGSLIVSNPTLTQVNNQLAADDFGNYCFVANCDPTTIKYLVDLSPRNASSVLIDGLDLDAKYGFDTGVGSFSLDATGSYFLDYKGRITAETPFTPGAGLIYTPPKFRGKFNLSWTNGGWSGNARVNYSGAERNPSDPACPTNGCNIDSLTTLDLALAYRFSDVPDAHFLDGVRLGVSVANVFNTYPPYAYSQTGINYDSVNANPLGRTLAVTLVKKW